MRKELPSGGGRILGDSSPRIQPGFGAEKRNEAFLLENSDLTVANSKEAGDHTPLRLSC